ncbi:MAG: DUF4124 domain-containing protein [Gammaproteobacteria bacterium]
MHSCFCSGISVLLLACCSPACSEPIYKSVDSEGRVTFSSKPPVGARQVEEIQIQRGPTAAQIEATKARANRTIEQAQERRSPAEERRQTKVAAREKLRDAQAALEKAKVIQPEDWQHLAGGGRHLKQSYFDRIKEHEAAVEKATKALHAVR